MTEYLVREEMHEHTGIWLPPTTSSFQSARWPELNPGEGTNSHKQQESCNRLLVNLSTSVPDHG